MTTHASADSEWVQRIRTATAYDAGRNGTTPEQELGLREMFMRMAWTADYYGITVDMIKERLSRRPEDRFYCPPDSPTG